MVTSRLERLGDVLSCGGGGVRELDVDTATACGEEEGGAGDEEQPRDHETAPAGSPDAAAPSPARALRCKVDNGDPCGAAGVELAGELGDHIEPTRGGGRRERLRKRGLDHVDRFGVLID
jgi:hypothetical protein